MRFWLNPPRRMLTRVRVVPLEVRFDLLSCRNNNIFIIIIIGDDKLRSVLTNATKKDEVVKKAMVPTKSYYGKRKKNSSFDRDRSRSRDRSGTSGSRSRNPSSSSWKSKGSGYQKKKRKSSSYNTSSSSKKKKADKDKSGNIPTCFSTAWNSYISPTVLLILTSIGLVVDNIPKLDAMPLGGRIQHCYENWAKICDNNWVLSVVRNGYKIPLKQFPHQRKIPKNPTAVGAAHEVLVKEAADLKTKHAIKAVVPVQGHYISSYFAVPKPRKVNAWRPILNLKFFNDFVKKYHFSMETLSTVRDWLQPGYYCISLDIKDAYLNIPMHRDSKKYLRFSWLGELLQWESLPFGLTCSPRVLTKILKPVIAFIRRTWNVLISIYMDDILIQSESPAKCILHAQIVMVVLMALGWSIKFEKCTLMPSRTFTHLGFDFNTENMTILCPQPKIARIQEFCQKLYLLKKATVLELEKLLGTFESVKPCVPLATLHFRSLQRQLLSSKKKYRKPFKIVCLSETSLKELNWWIDPSGFQSHCSAPIREPQPSVQIWSDANLSMAGGHCSRGRFYQRAWSKDELMKDPHINLLEIRAAREALALADPGDCVRLHVDSRTACSYIRRQGGTRSSLLSREACLLWREALSRNLTILSPVWISTKENCLADFLSRNNLEQWEFRLSHATFLFILDKFNLRPTLDVFASSQTKLLDRYMSLFPDTAAVARDALINKWDPVSWVFPPVPLIMKSLQKIQEEELEVIMIVPLWPTSIWWSMLETLMVEPYLKLPHYKSVLTMVNQDQDLPFLDPLIALHLKA